MTPSSPPLPNVTWESLLPRLLAATDLEGLLAGFLPIAASLAAVDRVSLDLLPQDAHFFLTGPADSPRLAHTHPLRLPANFPEELPGIQTGIGRPYAPYGTLDGAFAYVPLREGAELWGILRFENLGTRPFTEAAVENMERLGELLLLGILRIERSDAQRDADRRFRELVEDAGDFFFTVNPSGRIAFANHQAQSVLGLSPEELRGRDFFQLLAPEDRDGGLRVLREALARGEPRSVWQGSLLLTGGGRTKLRFTFTSFYRHSRLIEWQCRAVPTEALPRMASSPRRLSPLLAEANSGAEAVWPRALEALAELWPAQGYCACELSAAQVTVRAVAGLNPDLAGRTGVCLGRSYAAERHLFSIQSLADDPRSAELLVTGAADLALTAVPVWGQDRALGSLCLFHRDPAYLSEQDETLLAALASEVRAALETARLFQKDRQQMAKLERALSLLQGVSHSLSVLPQGLQALADSLLTSLADLLPARHLGLFILETDHPVAATAAWPSGLRPPKPPDDGSDGLHYLPLASTALAGEPALAATDLSHLAWLPFRSGEALLGCAFALTSEKWSPDPDEGRILEIYARWATIALQNALLHLREQENVGRLEDLNRLIKEQHESLKRSLVLHERLTQAVLEGDGIQGLTRLLAELAGKAVLLEDPYGEILAHADPETPASATAPAATFGPQSGIAQSLADGQPQWLESQGRLVAPVVAGGELLGYVSLLGGDPQANQLNLIALEHTATAIALEMLRQKAIFETEQRLRGDFLEDLLFGDAAPEEVLAQGHRLGYDLKQVTATLVVRANPPEPRSPGNRRLWQTVQGIVKDLSPSSVVIAQGEAVVLLATHPDPSHLAVALRERLETSGSWPISIGIGGGIGITGIRSGYQEARQALDILATFETPGVASMPELGVLGMLFKNLPHPGLSGYSREALKPLQEYDSRHGASLLFTLETYLAENAQAQKTAQKLLIHVSTLKYRLGQIERLLQVDLKRPEHRFNLQVAILIRQLAGRLRDSQG